MRSDALLGPIQKNELDQARKSSHALKGTAANLGMDHLYNSAKNLETKLSQNDVENISSDLEQVSTDLQNVLEEISKIV